MRVAVLVAALWSAVGWAVAADIASARYSDPTTRYAHGVLGDAIEHGTLALTLSSGKRLNFVLPEARVFEDTEPRLFDVDGDGEREVIVVESDRDRGARLAIYDASGLLASTDYIGRSHRWLAPTGIGAADLDGDGTVELAFVDRPHLAKTLRVFRFQKGALVPLASLKGVTNHRIGETDIAGGIRACGPRPEIIVADAGWRRILAVSFEDGELVARDLGPHGGRADFAAAMTCGK